MRRRDYFVFDRHHLAYLNAIEKLNCAYCSYANGLVAYVREIAGRTEQFWCPIKHARRAIGAHAHYVVLTITAMRPPTSSGSRPSIRALHRKPTLASESFDRLFRSCAGLPLHHARDERFGWTLASQWSISLCDLLVGKRGDGEFCTPPESSALSVVTSWRNRPRATEAD